MADPLWVQFVKEELLAFPLESSPKYGDVMLVFFEGRCKVAHPCSIGWSLLNSVRSLAHKTLLDGPEIWFRDLNGRWSFLAETFANYYRMMITHLGIVSWQVSNNIFSIAKASAKTIVSTM